MGGSTLAAQFVTKSALHLIPMVGPLVGFVAEPAMGYTTTFAIGHSFLEHLKKNGSLADFDFVKMKNYFLSKKQEAKEIYKKRFK